MLQDNYLFADTIARNIAFGEDEPDMDRVLWAAQVASAHEFIERLPLGYDTKIGETGLAISGGQRQRIAIARAIYHKPPILIFDEATSALDTESERAVKENIDGLLNGRTSFIIAHRLSTVRGADLILVLERGRLVEHGTHDDLMAAAGTLLLPRQPAARRVGDDAVPGAGFWVPGWVPGSRFVPGSLFEGSGFRVPGFPVQDGSA